MSENKKLKPQKVKNKEQKMRFSVIIPAKNEEKDISSAVKSVREQYIVPRSDYEIIVVDNNSTDNTAQMAKKAGADKVIFKKEPGTNPARQAGVDAADKSSNIICFLDADSQAPPTWLERIRQDLVGNGSVAVSGPYDLGFKGFMEKMNYLYVQKLYPHIPALLHFLFRKKAGIIIGGNFAAYRSAIDSIGGLPPIKFYGDDATIAMLISRRVGPVLFDPKLVVKSSPRRFGKGGIRTIYHVLKYDWEYIKAYFRS